MDDLHQQIHELIETEHHLRQGEMDDAARQQLADLEVRLDQVWDLLRQRDARRAAGADPSAAQSRPANEVEGYLQ
jgi:hypothetical protein